MDPKELEAAARKVAEAWFAYHDAEGFAPEPEFDDLMRAISEMVDVVCEVKP
jgi:hypothetical protein